ncbi:hypothetical protein, partial [Tenacibaculum ovolyticum]|uniref:hypothetical protein n=1 Tax=Tenacibaculum ovolyticum TaxID=104270 RepID=UPI000AD13173
IELTDNLRKEHVNGGITCFFLNKSIDENDFYNDKGFILSSVSDLELKSKTTKYNYVVKTFFKTKRYDNNISSNDRENIVLKGVLNLLKEEPNCISCVATSVGYMGMPKRYISNTMYIPKENIKKIME